MAGHPASRLETSTPSTTLLNRAELARFLGRSRFTVDKLIADPTFPRPYRVLCREYWPAASVLGWLEQTRAD